MAGILGLRGTGDWATDQRPKSWRDGILYIFPNGDAPLTAMTARLASQPVDDPEFNWWTKTLETQRAAVTGVYTDSLLAVAYSSGGTAGQTLYVKMSAADSIHFREGHQVLLRDASDYTVDVNAKVTAKVTNGASSYVAVKLLEADDNSSAGDLSDCDTALVIGNINAEGGAVPSGIAYDPTKHYNYTQIFWTPMEITRTARKTMLRTGDAYKELKRETLQYHSIEMEKAFLWGIPTENTSSDNGKPERTTGGLVCTIKTDAAANCNDYSLNSSYSGKTWLQGGEEWLDYYLEQIFRYGSRTKTAFCGSGAILGINKLVKAYGNFNFTATTAEYGIQVKRWITPFGDINLIIHPLFSFEATNRNSMVVFEPEKIKYRYIDDTEFYPDGTQKVTGYTKIDGTKDAFLTECGLEFGETVGFGYLNGVGTDNAV